MKKELVKKMILKKETVLNASGGNLTSQANLFNTRLFCGPTRGRSCSE